MAKGLLLFKACAGTHVTELDAFFRHYLLALLDKVVELLTNVLTLAEAVTADEKAYGGLHQALASHKCEHKVNESKLMNEKGFKSVHRRDHFLLAMDDFYMMCLLLDSWIYYKTINNDTDSDAVAFSANLERLMSEIVGIVRTAHDRAHDEYARAAKAQAHGRTSFDVGDLVIIHGPRTDKLDLEWKGPLRVVERESPTMYVLSSLIDNTTTRAPASRLHAFVAGDLTADQLRAEACPHGEFLVDRVFAHEFDDDGICWLEIRAVSQRHSEANSWVAWPDCRYAPAVRDYASQQGLHLTKAGRESRARKARTFRH
eukprot:m51a1_g13486 hypothetical protein (315) ;mRNA; f:563-1968